jgi:hypothetical protein
MNQERHIGEAPQKFLTYIRTKEFYQLRLRNERVGNPVHISSKEIESRFFIFPQYKRKDEIRKLVDSGDLEITVKKTRSARIIYYYRALRAGGIDLSLLFPLSKPLDTLTLIMKEYVLTCNLPKHAPSTPYFDSFLEFRNQFPDLFFIIDRFSGRIHTPVTNFHRTHRPNLLLYSEKTASLDITTMQPLLLGKILKEKIGDNEFSAWIDTGEDIYLKLQKKAHLMTRDEGKKKFFEILFARPNNALERLFGASEWIKWINEYKSQPVIENPHTIEKEYSNMAWLLQSTEVNLMRKVWERLVNENIPFLSVHDEIIVRKRNLVEAEGIFRQIMEENFAFYNLNNK